MVTTLSPNANDTPTSPIPTCGKPAAMTALPHPANVNQNVPMASAAYFFASLWLSPQTYCCRVAQNSGNNPGLGATAPKSGPNNDSFAAFHGFSSPSSSLHRWTFTALSDTSARSRLGARPSPALWLYPNSY